MDTVDLRHLDENLHHARTQFEVWARGRLSNLEEVQRTWQETTARVSRETETLVQRRTQFEAAAARLQERLEAEREELDALERGIAQLEARAAALPVRQQELEQEIAERRQEFERRRALLNACEEARRTRLLHLQKALVWYRDRLGLRFQRVGAASATEAGRVDGKVRVIFRHIDSRAPDREFAFTVYVDEDADLFRVEDCVPDIDVMKPTAGAANIRLAQMVETLNRTNDFGAFVAQMRRRFKAWVQMESTDQLAGRQA
jgi:vacuolar-type H+-ATPase subunit I/STV1